MIPLLDVKTVVENVWGLMLELVDDETLTLEQATLIFPVVLESILKSNCVGSS